MQIAARGGYPQLALLLAPGLHASTTKCRAACSVPACSRSHSLQVRGSSLFGGLDVCGDWYPTLFSTG
jgi:hypothetical protein